MSTPNTPTCVIDVNVTTYLIMALTDDKVHERVTTERMAFVLYKSTYSDITYVNHASGPQGLPLDSLVDCCEKGRNWRMQSGTPPVKVDGTWGGRNYPDMFVENDQLQLLQEAFAS